MCARGYGVGKLGHTARGMDAREAAISMRMGMRPLAIEHGAWGASGVRTARRASDRRTGDGSPRMQRRAPSFAIHSAAHPRGANAMDREILLQRGIADLVHLMMSETQSHSVYVEMDQPCGNAGRHRHIITGLRDKG